MSNTPANLLYNKTHEWVKIDGDEAIIGITAFAQASLGDVTYVDLPQVGDTVTQGKEFGGIESVKAASDLFSPVNGEIIEVNESLVDAPQNCNNDPYGDGWIIKVKLSAQPEGLLAVAAYDELCANEKH